MDIYKKRKKIYGPIGLVSSILGIIAFYFIFFPPNTFENKINEIYPNIIIDYSGAGVEKIKNDFGVPYNEYTSFEGIDKYLYKLKNGEIIFGEGREIHSKGSKIKLYLPYIQPDQNIGSSIILGETTFGDICKSFHVNKIESSWGTMHEAKYTEVEFYTGWVGQYINFIFGTYYSTGDNFSLGESYKYIKNNTDISMRCDEYSDTVIDYIKINH